MHRRTSSDWLQQMCIRSQTSVLSGSKTPEPFGGTCLLSCLANPFLIFSVHANLFDSAWFPTTPPPEKLCPEEALLEAVSQLGKEVSPRFGNFPPKAKGSR